MKKPSAFIVVYDDGDAIRIPMSDDADCLGALCLSSGNPVRLFRTKKEARRAISVSRAFAVLCRAQGKPTNDDFLEGIKNVRVLPCVSGPAQEGKP